MNELKLLLATLIGGDSKVSAIPGARTRTLLETLGMEEEEMGELMWLLGIIGSFLSRLGLTMKYNPLDDRWFIAMELDDLPDNVAAKMSPLPPSLAATLYAILQLIRDNGEATTSSLKKLRKKETIDQDLQKLEKQKFIKMEGETITLGPALLYHVNIEELLKQQT